MCLHSPVRAGPHRAGERAGTLRCLVPSGPGPSARRRDAGIRGRRAGAGWAGGGAAGVIVLQLCAPEGADDVESALGPARPRRPALRESLRSWAGVTRSRPTLRRGSGAEAAGVPFPGPAGGGVWRGASEGEGASFCLRGRCAARLRARAGAGLGDTSALRSAGAGGGCAPSFKGLLGRAAPPAPAAGGGVGIGFPGPLPPPAPRTTVLPLSSQSGFEPPKVLVTPWKYLSSPREACFSPPSGLLLNRFQPPHEEVRFRTPQKKSQFHTPSKKEKASRGRGCAGASVSHPSPVGKQSGGFSASEVGSPSTSEP